MPHKDPKLIELERSIEKMQRETELTFSVMNDKKKASDLWVFIAGVFFCAVSMCLLKQAFDSIVYLIGAALSLSGGVVGGIFRRRKISSALLVSGYIALVVAIVLSISLIKEKLVIFILFCVVYLWGTIMFWIYNSLNAQIKK